MNKNNKAILFALLVASVLSASGCRKEPAIVSNPPSPKVTAAPQITPSVTVTPQVTQPSPSPAVSDQPTEDEKSTLGTKALRLVNIMHSGDDVSLKKECSSQDYNRLLEYMNMMEGNKLQKASISGYHKNSSSEIIIFVEVYAGPDSSVQFYEMKFKRSGTNWLLSDIGFDA